MKDYGESHGARPLVAGTIRGFRCWRWIPPHYKIFCWRSSYRHWSNSDNTFFQPLRVEDDQKVFLAEDQLYAIHCPYPWTKGENTAECALEGRACPCSYHNKTPTEVDNSGRVVDVHTAPKLNCHCGFYGSFGFDPLDDLWNYALRGYPPVYGIVEGYGKVIVGDEGFRAEKARIIALSNRKAADMYEADYITESQLRNSDPSRWGIERISA